MKDSALVILSGGQDSTTCLFWAKNHFKEVHAITFDYGQRHRIEIESARRVAEMAGVASHEIVEMPNLLVSTSPLTSSQELDRYADAAAMAAEVGDRVEKTFVPMRNTLFFVVAMNRAVALGCPNLVTGICEEDNANYPDCTAAFRDSFEAMANQSLGTLQHGWLQDLVQYKVLAPLLHLDKAATVMLANALPGCWEALAYTHTSYDGKYPPVDNNHSNLLRAEGFARAGLPDPLVVRAFQEGLMDLPPTQNYDRFRNQNHVE